RGDGHESATGAGGLVFLQSHELMLLSDMRCRKCGALSALDLCSLEDLDLVAFAHLDDRLLPALLLAENHSPALRLRPNLRDVHGHDLDLEELLDGLPDLRLVRVRM